GRRAAVGVHVDVAEVPAEAGPEERQRGRVERPTRGRAQRLVNDSGDPGDLSLARTTTRRRSLDGLPLLVLTGRARPLHEGRGRQPGPQGVLWGALLLAARRA